MIKLSYMDERFFAYRERATRISGIVGVFVAVCLFEYRLLVKHVWEWDLLAVVLTIVVIKMGLMAWYYQRDRAPQHARGN